MHIIYKITYKPHLNTNLPKYYIGSKYNYKGNYYGSVSSQEVTEYTNGLSLKKWWKTLNKDDLIVEVLDVFDNITPEQLVLKEREYHDKMDVLTNDYFNSCKANKGFVSKPKTTKTKEKMSNSLKAFYSTTEGKSLAARAAKNRIGKKRLDVSERNKTRIITNITKQKISTTMSGRTLSSEHREKIAVAMKKKVQPRSVCTVCGKETTNANIAKWHNNKCKGL